MAYEFGVSFPKIPDETCVLLVPPLGRQVGIMFLVDRINVWKLDLNDTVLSEHRNNLGITYEPAKKVSKGPVTSESVLNYEFVHDHMKQAVNALDYTIQVHDHETLSVDLKYTVNHVVCRSSFSGFSPSNVIEIMRNVSRELHRVYESIHDIKEIASAQGIDLTTISGNGAKDLSVIEKLQQAELRRANLSSVNPNVRSKKVTKGFGGK